MKGFTLLELLIVISLVGIIGLFTWPALYQFSGRQELQNESQSIVALLRTAQQRSIVQENGQSWGVKFDSFNGAQSDRYSLFSTTQSPSETITNLTTSMIVSLKQNLSFSQPLASSLIITFKQLSGEAALSNCSQPSVGRVIQVNLKNTNQSSSITVFCNGKIQF